jgi:outer membrane lipoprotein-sorting protein
MQREAHAQAKSNPGRRRRIVFACAVLGMLGNAGHAAQTWQLADLMRVVRESPHRDASFTERRTVKAVDGALESSGTLHFQPPDRLEKHTVKPKPENLIVDGDELILQRPQHRDVRVSLEERPELAALIESIRGTLAGDASALERVYRVQLEGDPTRWNLHLVPRSAAVARIVANIRIAGSQGELARVEFQFADGDRSEMTVSPDATP